MNRALLIAAIIGGTAVAVGVAIFLLLADDTSPQQDAGRDTIISPPLRDNPFPEGSTAIAAKGRYGDLWGTEFTAAIPPATDDEDYLPPKLATTIGHLPVFVNRKATENRVTPDISTRLRQVSHEDDLAALASVVLDLKDSDTVRHEAIECLRRSSYPLLDDLLIHVFSREDESERFRSFLAQHIGIALGDAHDERQGKLLQLCLAAFAGDRHLGVRRQMMQNLFRIRDEKIVRLLKTEGLTGKPTDGMRDLAIRYLHELDSRESIPAIRGFLTSENEVEAIAAIYVLGEWNDTGAKETIQTAAQSDKPRIKRAAEAAMKKYAQ